ncbi:MAG: SMC-Scp complex subunit ScpB [Patescibacteria group bacterium]
MEHPLNLSARIEALLFFKGEPVSVKFLAETLEVSEDEAREGVSALAQTCRDQQRGVLVVQNGDEAVLATTSSMSTTIEKITKGDAIKELGKAGLETLSLVLYRGPISRSSINYIRGVNSNYILRSLLVRGLIEKVEDKTRGTAYQPTFELLSYMGVTKVADLPEYEGVQKSVEEFNETNKKDEYEEDESFGDEA